MAPEPAVVDLTRRVIGCPIILVTPGAASPDAARAADGVVDGHDSPETCGPSFQRILDGRRREGRDDPFELWTRVKFPADRAHWKQTLADYDAAGATGLVVLADPRLLDLLRNPDEDDDRSDLTLAQG